MKRLIMARAASSRTPVLATWLKHAKTRFYILNSSEKVEIGRERERDLFQVITLSKYVLKIIVHYSLLDSRSNMVITDLLPGAPWMFLLAVLCFFSSSLSFLMALHPVYISV